MKSIFSVLTMLLLVQSANASRPFLPGTTITCKSSHGSGFELKVISWRASPYDDAIVTFDDGSHNFQWLQWNRTSSERGPHLFHHYTSQYGHHIVITENWVPGNNSCRGGPCGPIGHAEITARMDQKDGPTSHYSCVLSTN